MISCHEYDYIEIACMYHYSVELSLRNGSKVKGIAWDTGRSEDKQECLILKIEDETHEVLLQDVKALTALVKNPHFTTVTFS
jgi:Rho-binding antiterminator